MSFLDRLIVALVLAILACELLAPLMVQVEQVAQAVR